MFNLNVHKGVFYASVGHPCVYLGNHWLSSMYLSDLSPLNVADTFSVTPNYSISHCSNTVPTVDHLLKTAQDQVAQQNVFDIWRLEKVAIQHEQVRLLFRRWSKLDHGNNPRSVWLRIDQPFLAANINIHNANSSTEILHCLINMGSDELRPVQIDITAQSADTSTPPTLSTYSF